MMHTMMLDYRMMLSNEMMLQTSRMDRKMLRTRTNRAMLYTSRVHQARKMLCKATHYT
jgi:hypothetical protein